MSRRAGNEKGRVSMPISRRNLLRGAGVCLALPFLESLAPRGKAQAQASAPRRFLASYFPNGAAASFDARAGGGIAPAAIEHLPEGAAAGLAVEDVGAPIDVLWFRVSRDPATHDSSLARVGRGRFMVTIDRGDYWQCAFVIPKGGAQALMAQAGQADQERQPHVAQYGGAAHVAVLREIPSTIEVSRQLVQDRHLLAQLPRRRALHPHRPGQHARPRPCQAHHPRPNLPRLRLRPAGWHGGRHRQQQCQQEWQVDDVAERAGLRRGSALRA